MPVAAHFDPDSRIVMFRCSGNVAINEARRAFDQMMTDPAFEPDTHALWDLRGAVIVEKPRAIPDILDMLHNRHPERVAGSRVAILVTEETTRASPASHRPIRRIPPSKFFPATPTRPDG